MTRFCNPNGVKWELLPSENGCGPELLLENLSALAPVVLGVGDWLQLPDAQRMANLGEGKQ